MRLFQAALDTCLDSPFFASLSVHGLHFTVYAPSISAAGDTLFSEVVSERASQSWSWNPSSTGGISELKFSGISKPMVW